MTQIKVTMTMSPQEKDYLEDAYRRYISLKTGEILTLNKWLLNKIIEAIKKEEAKE